MPTNAARDVALLASNNPDGWHTWTVDEVAQFEKRHPIGTKARLALALLLFSGQRRSDITRFGKQHVITRTDKKGIARKFLAFTQFKGRNRKPVRLVLPILPVLQAIIDASPVGESTFLVNNYGKAFTDAGFGNWFRDRCVEAKVPGRAHGLRKAGATIAANNGATAHQLMAIFGWRTLKMTEHYTRSADQARLAEEAMSMLIDGDDDAEQKDQIQGPTEGASGTFSEKNSMKSNGKLPTGAQERTRTSTVLPAST
jgi:integrase